MWDKKIDFKKNGIIDRINTIKKSRHRIAEFFLKTLK
jgi:hypothetical protein